MKTILVCVDFSEPIDAAIAEAVRIAALTNAGIVVLSVVRPPPVDRTELQAGTVVERGLIAIEDVQRRLNQLREDLAKSGTQVETRYRVGEPGPWIVDTAAALGADFIVLGAVGHGALYEMMVGSTASHVLKHANAPVLVVPSRLVDDGLAASTSSVGKPHYT